MGRIIHLSVLSVLLLLCASLLPIQANAGWSHDPAVNTAITTQGGSDTNPAVIADGAGGAIIAWMDPAKDIRVQKIDANGNPLWGANGKALTSGGNNYYPQLASDMAGGAIVTWQGSGNGSGYIYVQRLNAGGIAQWNPGGEIECNTAGNHQYPQIAGDGTGGAIITWQDSRNGGSNYDIYAQWIDAYGLDQWAANGEVICTASGNQYYPQLIGDGSGGAIITWQDGRDGRDVYAQRIGGNGKIQWDVGGVVVAANGNYHEKPQIVSDGSGGAIITWQYMGSSGYDIYVQRIDASGVVKWTSNGVAVSTDAENQQDPQIVSDGSGGAIIAWWGIINGGGPYGIFAQRVDASGKAQWTTNGLSVATPDQIAADSYSPQIAGDGGNGAVITWADQRNGTDRNIYAQRIAAGGTVAWATNGVAVSTAANNQQFPKLIADGSGGFIITWQDIRSGGWDIYAQKVLADRTLPVVSPAVTTAAPVNITATTALGGGNVTSDGGSAITAKGICWGTTANPVIGGSCKDGSGSGTFTSPITGLTLSTPYHVRAFATNSIGTSYGSDLQFSTINKYALNLTFAGNGIGAVTWGSTTCGSACTFLVDPNTTAQLHAVPNPNYPYRFTSWTGACSGGLPDCGVFMNSDNRNVIATFTRDAANWVRILLPTERHYSSIGDAIRLDADGTAVIDAWGWESTESPTFNRGAFTLKGGWNQGYTSHGGTTTIIGTLTVQSGSLTVEKLAIR